MVFGNIQKTSTEMLILHNLIVMVISNCKQGKDHVYIGGSKIFSIYLELLSFKVETAKEVDVYWRVSSSEGCDNRSNLESGKMKQEKIEENGESYIMLSYMHCILRQT